MAATDGERPLFRRPSQVYVEIPPSSLHRSLSSSKHSPHVPTTTASHKENALLHPSSSQMTTNPILSPSSHKRKLEGSAEMADLPLGKKHKTIRSAASGKADDKKVAGASEEYPNGFVYCHQCNKKRDRAASIHCTAKDVKGRRCGAKYCKPCLKNRYGLILEDIVERGESRPTDRNEHIDGEGYTFKCPRCDDLCNCVACRKAKGLQPTGNLARAARQSGLTSAADVLRQDPKAAGRMARKNPEVITKAISQASDTHRKQGDPLSSSLVPHKSVAGPQRNGKTNVAASSAKGTKSRTVAETKKALLTPESLPKATWTPLNLSLSLREAEERINIREFSLRFASVLDISRSHLEELEELKPSRTRNAEDDDDLLVPWVSETCVRSLILGLLNLFDVRGENEKHLRAAIKSVRDSGANLNKIWAALATLRDWQNAITPASPNHHYFRPFLSLPDPLPPPESATVMRTRSGKNHAHTEGVNVFRTAQLVPVISALVDAAVETDAVREEIEAGIQEGKERAKEAREACRLENERFEQAKGHQKAKDKKAKMEQHKLIMADIDSALKVSSSAYIYRVSPLGGDMEGRVYWALTPGPVEREAALDHLKSYSQGRSRHSSSKARRRPLVPSEDDRRAMKKWSWFLAVWGKKPCDSECTTDDSEDEGAEDDEQWWGFWDPNEIAKVVAWLQSKSGLADFDSESVKIHSRSPREPQDLHAYMSDSSEDDANGASGSRHYDTSMGFSATPTKDELEFLVMEVERYATLLKCRIKRDEEIL